MQTKFYAKKLSSVSHREPKSDVTTNVFNSQSHFEAQFFDKTKEIKIRSSIKENIDCKNYVVAISLMNELIALDPDNAVDYNNRGLIHFRNNQLLEALEDLTYALEINPQLDSAYNNRANCHVARGDLISAIADYDEALDINPTNLRAWINQGITFREMDSYDLALENFNTVLILSHAHQEKTYGERGRTYHLQGDWNCAVADYQAALRLLSDLPNQKSYQLKVQSWLDELLDPILSLN